MFQQQKILLRQILQNNHYMEVFGAGAFSIAGTSNNLKLHFGGTVIFNTGDLDWDFGYWNIQAKIIRLSATTVFTTVSIINSGAVVVDTVNNIATVTETLSSAFDIKFTCTSDANTAASQYAMTVKYNSTN